MEELEDKGPICSSPAEPQFDYLPNSLAPLLKTASRELQHDREAANASLVTASPILQSEMERRLHGSTTRSSGLVGWQITRVRAFIVNNLDRTIYTRDLSAVARRSPAYFSRSFKQAFGEAPHAYVVRRRLE